MRAEQRMRSIVNFDTAVNGPSETGCAFHLFPLLTGTVATMFYALDAKEIGLATAGFCVIPSLVLSGYIIREHGKHYAASKNLLENARNCAVVDLPTLGKLNSVQQEFYDGLRKKLYSYDKE